MDMEERTPFGRRLFEARTAAGMTQEDAAKDAGMSQSTLAEAEISGKRSGFTVQLAALYKVSAAWLATGKGDRDIDVQPSATEGITKIQALERKTVQELLKISRLINDDGVNQLIGAAKMLLRSHPVAEAKRLSSR